MVERADITDEQFARLKQTPRGRWSDLVRRLKSGETVKVSIPKNENDARGRRRMHQQIYSAAYQAGIKTTILLNGSAFLVKVSGEVEA